MKRLNDEQIKPILNYYLRRRNYSTSGGGDLLYRPKKTLNRREMVLHGSTAKSELKPFEIAHVNRSDSAFVASVEDAFNNLFNFISKKEPLPTEFKDLLFTVFLHTFIELNENGHKGAAKRFYMKHIVRFTITLSRKELHDSVLISLNNNTMHSRLKKFRNSKTVIKITQDAALEFKKYLELSSDLFIQQIINTHTDINILNSDSVYDHKRVSNLESANMNSIQTNEDSNGPSSSSLLSNLKETIKKINEEPQPLPCICFSTLEGEYPSAIDVRQDLNYLATGFESSEVHLWSITSKAIPSSSSTSEERLNLWLEPSSPPSSSAEIPKEPSFDKIFRGHSGTVFGLSFLPDSNILLSCSQDKTIRAWDIDNGRCGAVYHGHDYLIWSIDSSPFGLYFVTGSKDTTARLWYPDRTFPLRIYPGHSMDVDSVKFHPNTKFFASGSLDKSVRLWDTNAAKSVRLFHGHMSGVHSLAFSPNGKLLASGSEDGRVKIWDIGMGTMMKEFSGHSDIVHGLSFNHDQSILASCGMDKTVKMWSLQEKQSFKKDPKLNDMGGGTSNEFSKLGKYGLASYPTKYMMRFARFMPHNLLFTFGAKP